MRTESGRDSFALTTGRSYDFLLGGQRVKGFASAVRAVGQKRHEWVGAREGAGQYVLANFFARVALRAGDVELALKYLGRACEERNVYALLIDSDPFYDVVSAGPRFKDLMERVGLSV